VLLGVSTLNLGGSVAGNRYLYCFRRWHTGAGLAGAAAAAVIAMGTAHADTPDDVIGQAMTDLNQGAAILDAAPTADLSAKQAEILLDQATFSTHVGADLNLLQSGQDGLSANDQTFLADADEQLVSAAQNMFSADQAFIAADQAGDLSGSGLGSQDLAFLDADLGFFTAAFDATGASFLATLDPDIGLDPFTALDPSAFADLLSSIGL
jgi:hypothetical protein